MLIPIRHEHMSARRWPIITIGLLVLNVGIFLATHDAMQRQSIELSQVKAHLLMLAAMRPDLKIPAEVQDFITNFRDHNPKLWAEIQQPNREVADAWDARIRMVDETYALQAEMDSLAAQYAQEAASSIVENYAFIPANPRPLAYLTANFLHVGWLHLIGNMWFLWLAGFVLEDAWGRPIYMVFYFVAGAAALQFYAWSNTASIIPTVGASGAVAALMGAFLVRFPTMRIDMAWVLSFRIYRFKAPAYWLLPLWLLMEVFYGSLFGAMSGVAHWAHVGGFVFGGLAALALRYTGLEHKANEAIEKEVSWTNDPAIVQATEMIGQGQLDEAIAVLKSFVGIKPDSIDGWNLLQQSLWKKGDVPAYQEATAKLCALHARTRQSEAALQDYQEFLNSGGTKLPPGTWLEVCRAAEELQDYERAVAEYKKLMLAYPTERQALIAQLGAARLCLKRLNRPQDALIFFEAASKSPIPHLDWDQNIETGIREARAALPPTPAQA